GGFAEPGADLAGFALHQVQRAWRGGDGALFTVHAAAGVRRVDDTPLGAPLVRVQSGAGFVAEELADVDTDAARADHRDTLTHRRAPENVHIGHHVRVVDPRNVGHTWADTGRDDHVLEVLGELPRFDAGVQVQLDTEQFQLAGVVTDRFGELFLPGYLFREVELAADLGFRFVEHHLVSPAGERRGRSQAGRARPDDGEPLRLACRGHRQVGLFRRPRVHQARGLFVAEHVIQTRLVAGNTRVDLVAAALFGFAGPFRVGQHRPGQRHQVGFVALQDPFGHIGHVD